MKRLITVAAVLAVAYAPTIASATTWKHHHKAHRAHATPSVAFVAPRDARGSVLPRIPSMDPEICDSPNVVTIEHCRLSSQGSF